MSEFYRFPSFLADISIFLGNIPLFTPVDTRALDSHLNMN